MVKSAEEQTQHSLKYTPKTVSVGKQDQDQDTQTYAEYVAVVKNQATMIKDLQDMLTDFVQSHLSSK